MKFIFLVLLLAAIPWFSARFAYSEKARRAGAFALSFLPLISHQVQTSVFPIAWPYWPGYVRGFEFGIEDAVAIAALIAVKRRSAPVGNVIAYAALGALALASAFHGVAPLASSFVAWQFARSCLVYLAVYRLCQSMFAIRGLIGGLTAGLCLNAIAATRQHFDGISQATGLFEHQNLLGMLSHFIVLTGAGLYIADRSSRWPLIALGAGAIVAVFGASRATVALQAIGLVAVIILSLVRRPSRRAGSLLAIGLFGMLLAAPFAYKAISPRIAAAAAGPEYDERAAFESAAKSMISDHPLGVGANHYVIVANTQGYSARAGVTWASGSRSANVHNAYLLTIAEMSYAALVPLIWLLGVPALLAVAAAFRRRRAEFGPILIGAGAANVMVAVHSTVEWIFVTQEVQLLLAANIGLIASALALQRSSAQNPPIPIAGASLEPALSGASATKTSRLLQPDK